MYEQKAVPENLKDLPFAEQFTLWSIRYWSECFRRNFSPYDTLKEAYRRSKCSEGFLSLESFLSFVVAGHSRPVDIRCLCCEGISLDEWRILQSLALAQAGNETEIAPLISHFLEPATIRICTSVIIGWAEELRQSEFVIPLRQDILSSARRNYAAADSGLHKHIVSGAHSTTLN